MRPTFVEEMAVIQAVTYSGLFQYPLTGGELAESLPYVVADAAEVGRWWADSPTLQAAIERRGEYFFPRGRADFVRARQRRQAVSARLLDEDRRLLALMGALPWVRMVALSGSLAHLNAEADGDLDLFVITAPRRVWLVTVVAIAAARLCGWRHRLCLNYVVSERALEVEMADVFSVNQVLHLRPITGEHAYRRFLAANPRLLDVYPNFAPRSLAAWQALDRWTSRVRRPLEWLFLVAAPVAERVCRLAYGWHLRRRSSSWTSREQVRLDVECLKLHTSSHRADVLARYDAALAAVCPTTERRKTG